MQPLRARLIYQLGLSSVSSSDLPNQSVKSLAAASASALFKSTKTIAVAPLTRSAPMQQSENSQNVRLDKSSGHHVTQTSTCSGNNTDLSVHTERGECSLAVLSVTWSLDIVSWVIVGPFLGKWVSTCWLFWGDHFDGGRRGRRGGIGFGPRRD